MGHGFGVSTLGTISYIGEYKNNRRHGWGMEMTSTDSFVGLFECGKRQEGTAYWRPNAPNPYFGPAIRTKCRRDTKTRMWCYVKTLWSNKVVTERYVPKKMTLGVLRVIFPNGIVFHTCCNNAEMDSRFLFSLSPKIKFKLGSVLL